MAICKACHGEMLVVNTCVPMGFVDAPGVWPIRYGQERPGVPVRPRCPDCNVVIGGYHHQNCDMERNPATGAQAICDERIEMAH